MAERPQSSADVRTKASDPFDLNALAQGGPDIVIPPTDKDLRKLCEDEKFMQEIIEIRINDVFNDNDPRSVEIRVDCGGITGPMGEPDGEYPFGRPGIAGRGGKSTVMVMKRGETYKVPRYVFEILAHSNVQTLKQETQGMNPEPINRMEKKFSYHFECVYDPNPKGRAWREARLRDPA